MTAPGAPVTTHDGPEASARPGVARGGATGADAREPVLSVVVMHHPARGDVSALVRACAPLDVRVVEDPDPDGPPSPLRTAKRAWAAVAPGATHHLVLQDDVTPVPGFADLVRRAVRARPRHAVALYSNWNSPRNAYLVRAAAAAGQAWAPLGHDEWVPTLGLVLPADGALRLAAHLATVPDDERDDDEAVVTFCARAGYPVVATLPHLLEHGDGPSLAGNDAHGARHATVPAGDAVDPDAWDRPALDRAPARTPATARPVAVTLDRSRCTLRVLRPHAGEPLEHPFGWGWDAWAWWLGADPAVVGRDVAALVAAASPDLAAVPRDALTELGAACWLLGFDVARTAWPEPAGPVALAHRAAAVRTWVLSGLLPVDRPDGPLDELVAFGLDALAGGETHRDPAARPVPGRPVPGRPVPGPPAVEGGRSAGPRTAMHAGERGVGDVGPGGDTALAAARLLAERDAEAVCRAAGPSVPLRVVAHDCPVCGARAAGAAPRLTAQTDLDADGDVATVEVLACEVVEPRGLLGAEPGGRYLSRGMWASRRAADRGADPARGTGPAADLLVALAHGDGTRSDPRVLPVVVRAAGDRPGVPSPAALGLQHATGPVQRYADEHAAARLARAAELL